jgi:hypothetical protein
MAGNKAPKITDFDTLEAYVNATLAADGPPKSMGKAGPGKIVPGKAGPGKAGPGKIISQKMRKPPQKGLSNG